MGLSTGLFIAWQLAFLRVSDLREKMRQRPHRPILVQGKLPMGVNHGEPSQGMAAHSILWVLMIHILSTWTIYSPFLKVPEVSS